MPEHILIVEDEQTLQETLAYNLEHQGYKSQLPTTETLQLNKQGNHSQI